MKRFPKINYLIVLSVVAAIAVSVVFRFFKLSDLFYFSLDEEVISFHISRITNGTHFPAIGVNAADTGLYLGPGYLYALAPFFLLLKNNPIAGAVASSLIGVLATVAFYIVGSRLFNKKVGIIAAILHASSLTIALFERKFFNPQPANLLGIVLLWSLHQSLMGKKIFLYVLAFCAGLIFHLNLSLVPYLLISLIFFLIKRPRYVLKDYLISGVIFCVILSPLAIFELRHNFQMTKTFFTTTLVSKKHDASAVWEKALIATAFPAKVFAQNLRSGNIVEESVTCDRAVKNMPHLMGFLIIIAAVIGLVNSKQTFAVRLLYVSVLVGAASLLLYPGRVQEYYAFTFMPAVVLLAAYGISRYHVPVIGIILFAVIVINAQALLRVSNPHGLTALNSVAKTIAFETDTPYNLKFKGDSCYGYGFDYLLQQKGIPPQTSFMDPVLGWLKTRNSTKKPAYSTVVIHATRDEVYATYEYE